MIGGIYYFVVPEDERLRISNLLRENLELQKVDSLKHIETNETQIVPEVENHQPTNSSFYQEEIADEYVEPATVPQVENNQPVAPATTVAPTTANTTTVDKTQKNDDKKAETTKDTQPTTVAPTKPETSSVELAPVPSNSTIEPKPAATETNNQ